MPNWLTKIAKVFRKKSTQQNQCDFKDNAECNDNAGDDDHERRREERQAGENSEHKNCTRNIASEADKNFSVSEGYLIQQQQQPQQRQQQQQQRQQILSNNVDKKHFVENDKTAPNLRHSFQRQKQDEEEQQQQQQQQQQHRLDKNRCSKKGNNKNTQEIKSDDENFVNNAKSKKINTTTITATTKTTTTAATTIATVIPNNNIKENTENGSCNQTPDENKVTMMSPEGGVSQVADPILLNAERQPPISYNNSSSVESEQSFIDNYKALIDEKQQLRRSSYDTTELCRMEEMLNASTKRDDLMRPSGAEMQSMTPEEREYEAQLAAELKDVMTPLPSSTLAVKPFPCGRNLQPEIVEVIRNLDAYSLRINSLTPDGRLELMRRSELSQQQQHQQQRRHSCGKKSYQQQEHEHEQQQVDDYNRKSSGKNLVGDVNVGSGKELGAEELEDEGVEAVVLRRKLPPERSGLFARRQPRSPKLVLHLQHRCGNEAKGSVNKHRELDISERNLMDLKYPAVLPPNPQLKALLVFHKMDNICEVLTEACHRQQLDVTLVKTKEAALETLQNAVTTECFHLIVIDARSSKHLDAEYITRSIRHTNGHHFTTIIAVVKKSFFEKDEVLIALLDAGVNRCMVETTNLTICNIELKQILHSIVRPHNVMSTQQALYTALHRLKEVLIISDDVLRIQYANKSAERLLNMRLDEIISKPLADIFVSDVSSISAQGKNIREFDGILTVRRKSQDGIPMHVRVVPVACIGKTPTHFVFNFDVPGGQTDFIATLPQPKEAPRGSLHSIRRGSFDVRSVASDGLRRTSLAKLTSLPLEAPITKIINLLSQVQENCSADEARLIDKVMEFLKREGLYSPQMKELRPDDPIATDLIGALLTGPSLYSSRRSSNDSIIRVTNRASTVLPAKMKATPLIMELLEESLSWEFDIFKLEEITEKRPLLYLGMEMFRRFDVFATFNVDENVCKGWLAVIEANYHVQNSYHNSTHAADVMQATGAFINQLAAKDLDMDRMDEATALIAAAAHDIDHPGRSSAFLCNSNSPLAILYNDLTVLESHHAATTFKLTLGDDKINIFKNLDKETYKSVRSTIIDMILATEMTRHFEHLAKFVSVFGSDVEPRDIVQNEEESSILIRRMLIKVADVSNPARPLSYCVEWSRRIAEEYFMQTDEEKAKSLPIVMPMFDRGTCSIPKSQIGFIEYIIQDMMHAWDSFIDMPQLITYMQMNYAQWKKFEEQGIHTLADIKTKQISLNAKKTTCK